MSYLSCHMIIKNGVKFDYPFIEACISVLPICDELVVIDGFSSDGTYERLVELREKHDKVKVFQSPWDREHYSVLSDLTNAAIEKCQCKYHFQIQGDEVLHEKYHDRLRDIVVNEEFDYVFIGLIHFYGGFYKIYKPKIFLDGTVRMARRALYPRIRSHSDAFSFGTPDSDPNSYKELRLDDINVHHYGFVRKPRALVEKQEAFVKYFNVGQDPLYEKGLERGHIDWNDKFDISKLDDYTGTHPAPLLKWIEEREPLVVRGSLE